MTTEIRRRRLITSIIRRRLTLVVVDVSYLSGHLIQVLEATRLVRRALRVLAARSVWNAASLNWHRREVSAVVE